MVNTKPLAILLLTLLTAILGTLIYAQGGFENLPAIIDRGAEEVERLKDALPTPKLPSPPPFTGGEGGPEPTLDLADYRHGTCTTDTNCAPAGCSNHICSSDQQLITTCEFNPDFPSDTTHSCGCVNQKCAWTKR